MSAVWLTIASVLCVLSVAEKNNVVWKSVGEDVDIKCRTSHWQQRHMYLKKGLHEETVLVFAEQNSTKLSIQPENRIQLKGKFPNITFTIKNLTSTDIGPHWCVYTRYDKYFKEISEKKNGSILLVIKEDYKADCSPKEPMYLIAIVVSAIAMSSLMLIIFLKVFKIRCFKNKPRRLPTNDVYEDMRGTIRR